MVVYIECVLINNLCMNTAIFYLAALIRKRIPIWWQIVISSTIGAIYALCAPLIRWQGEIALKLILSIAMCLLSSRFRTVKEYLAYLAVFYIVTFGFGGIIIGIANFYKPVYLAVYSPSNVSLGLILMLAVVVSVVARIVLQRRAIKRADIFESSVDISIGAKTYSALGYFDSGNTVYYRGIYPVVAVKKDLLSLPVGKLKLKTLTDTREVQVYPLKSLAVGGKVYKNVFAVPQPQESKYEIILHSSMI